MLDKYWILKDKKVIEVNDVLEWGRFFKKTKERIVKQETLPSGYWVSTVFLGIDHNFELSGSPLLFETMVFSEKEGKKDEVDMERYATYEEAEKGHEKMVNKYKNETSRHYRS